MLLVVLAVVLCITGSAIAAGLTLGLLSLDPFDMLVLLETNPAHCDTDSEREQLLEDQANARLVHPLLEDHHRLLVTLLLLNCICAEMLPLFLDELFPSWVAVLLSVTFILMFGEIIPSAVFSNSKNGLANSAKFTPLVSFLLVAMAPVAVPVARVLDRVVGREENHVGTYSKPELRSLLRLHQTDEHLTKEQSRMMGGAMDLMTTRVFQEMTPVDRMFTLSTDAVLDVPVLADILGRGYTRIPVHHAGGEPGHVKGLLLTLSLIVVDSADARRVGEIGLRHPPVVSPNITLHDLLDYNAPFFFVSDQPEEFAKRMRMGTPAAWQTTTAPPKLLGCITAMDVIKCITKKPMRDEFTARQYDDEEEEEEEEQQEQVLGPTARKLVMRWANRARTEVLEKTERARLLEAIETPQPLPNKLTTRRNSQLRKTTSLNLV